MNKTDKEQDPRSPSLELLEKARAELRKRLLQEELEFGLRVEILDRLMTDLNVDAQSFHTFWLQPLMKAGATLDTALRCIAQSQSQPN